MSEEVVRPGSENNPHLVDTPRKPSGPQMANDLTLAHLNTARPKKKRVRTESNAEERGPGSFFNPLPVADSPRTSLVFLGPAVTDARPQPDPKKNIVAHRRLYVPILPQWWALRLLHRHGRRISLWRRAFCLRGGRKRGVINRDSATGL
jgi:hypothetical protein